MRRSAAGRARGGGGGEEDGTLSLDVGDVQSVPQAEDDHPVLQVEGVAATESSVFDTDSHRCSQVSARHTAATFGPRWPP